MNRLALKNAHSGRNDFTRYFHYRLHQHGPSRNSRRFLKSHAATFTAGSNGTYTIAVSNTGSGPATSGPITVTDVLHQRHDILFLAQAQDGVVLPPVRRLAYKFHAGIAASGGGKHQHCFAGS